MRRSLLSTLLPSIALLTACASDAGGSASLATTSPALPASSNETSRDAGTGPVGTPASASGGPAPDGAVVSGGPDAGGGATEPPAPTVPAVQFLGRFDARDPGGPKAAWPGATIVARFRGTSVTVKMNEIDYGWQEGSPSEWDASIDGELLPKIVMQPGTRDYPVASGLAAGEHTVELFKRSEAQNGVTQFLGFDFEGGTLLPPPARKARRIELIGDSQPAAFGIEGIGPDCDGPDWAARWQNFHKSVGVVLARALGAELNGTIYSGKGIAKNIWHADLETMPQLFLRADPLDPKSTWDFAEYVPAAVLIMMGGNDFAIGRPTDDGGPATLAQFTDAFEGFARTIRGKYPEAHVFLIVSPSVSDDQPEGRQSRTNVVGGIRETVRRRHAAGDARVYEVTPPVAVPGELTACNGHGTVAFHQRLADQLAPLVRAATGWN